MIAESAFIAIVNKVNKLCSAVWMRKLQSTVYIGSIREDVEDFVDVEVYVEELKDIVGHFVDYQSHSKRNAIGWRIIQKAELLAKNVDPSKDQEEINIDAFRTAIKNQLYKQMNLIRKY